MQGKQRAQFLAPSHVIPFAQYGRHHRSAETGVAAAVPSPAVGRDTEAGTAVPSPVGTGTAAVAKVEVGIVVASRVALAVAPNQIELATVGSSLAVVE